MCFSYTVLRSNFTSGESTGVRRINNSRIEKKSRRTKKKRISRALKLGFPAEIQVSGLYRKVREGSSLISSNFH